MKSLVKLLLLICTTVGFQAAAFTSKSVDDPKLEGTLYYTSGNKDQPVLIILGGSEGGSFVEDHYVVQAKIKQLVNKGYAVFALTYFDYFGKNNNIPKALARIPLEYFEQSFDWLNEQPEIRKNSFAIYGSSRGAELALILSSMFTQVDAVIAGLPSAFVGGSYSSLWETDEWESRIKADPCEPAWTWKGKDLKSICNKDVAEADPWYDVIYNEKITKGTVIEVEKATAAILLLSGKNDQVWPSTYMSDLIIKRLEQHNFKYFYEHKAFDTGHFLFLPTWSNVVSFLDVNFPI